jgi:serpin B
MTGQTVTFLSQKENRMKRTTWARARIMTVATLTVAFSATINRAENESIGILVKGNNAFALNIYRKIAATEGNLLFSPYSLSSALAMTSAGARENTAKELKDTLQFQLDQDQLPSVFKELNKTITTQARKTGQKVLIANGLCLTSGDVSKEFKDILLDKYEAKLFSGRLDEINEWVKIKTEGKIDKILEKIAPDSVCVLINAIYFKGTWKLQFKKSQTHQAPFNLSPKKTINIPLMYQRGMHKLMTKETFQAVVLPYTGDGLSMIVLLPTKVGNLQLLEKQLTADALAEWVTEIDKQPVQEIDLFLPKFKLSAGYDMISPCKELGITDAFDKAKADFSGMAWNKENLWIAQIKHKTFIDVNEVGTEAFAATVIEVQTESIPSYPVFRADHPFIFIIRDNVTGALLFIGRVVNPSAT